MIDWAATGECMQAWAGFAGAGAVVYAAYVGGKTYKTWLLQKQTERKLHAAEQVLTAVYKARSALENVRAGFMPAYELEAAERKLVEGLGDEFKAVSETQRQNIITAQAMLMRIARYHDTWDELPANMALAFAFLDTSVEASLKLLFRQVIIIQSSAETFAKHHEIEGDGEDRKFVIGLRRDLWGGMDENDRVGAAIMKAVTDIEAVVRPLLRSDLSREAALP
jgi:hypothetical protein